MQVETSGMAEEEVAGGVAEEDEVKTLNLSM